jgi:hypothetical protein
MVPGAHPFVEGMPRSNPDRHRAERATGGRRADPVRRYSHDEQARALV